MGRSWPRRLASLAGAAAAGLLPLTITSGAVAAPAPPGVTWAIQPSPSQPGALESQLSSVSCLPGGACTAVGSYYSDPKHEFALALERTGTKWALEPTPDIAGSNFSQLNGVSCAAANSCAAVGFTLKRLAGGISRSLAERWNGTTWALAATPALTSGASLAAVSCPKPAFCLAVGGFTRNASAQEQPLAEEWNGTSWRQLTVPNPNAENGSSFTGVDCTAVNQCEVTGDFAYADVAQKVIAESFNGTSWTTQKQVNPLGQELNSDNAVSCTSASACTSAGSWTLNSQLGLAERWNGTAWSRQSLPMPAKSVTDDLSGVSCAAATACTAVGESAANGNDFPSATMAMSWNGTSWRLATTPNPAGQSSQLNGVSCSTPSTCVAVGVTFGTATGTTLVEVSS